MIGDYRRVCRWIGVTLTPEQEWACAWLEKHGKRFLYDFGYENCVAMALDWPIGPVN